MEVVTEVSESEWRAFLDSTRGSNVFQSPDMVRVYRKSKGYRPILVAAESGGRLRTLMVSAVVSYTPRRFSSLTARAIVTGGPLGDQDAFSLLLAAHDGMIGNSVLLTQVRNLGPPADRTPFESAGYRWEDQLNFLIDLRKGEAALLAGMSKARRKGIAHAERAGLDLCNLRSTDLVAAYRLLQKTYSRASVPLADRSLFEAALEELGSSGHIIPLAAVLDGELMAVRLVLRWGETLYDWYAGSDLDQPGHADEWLVWQVLRQGISDGCNTFDFGGAGKPDEPYGPREFKRRFGGETVNPGRFEKVYRPLTLRAAKAAYKAWRLLQ